VFFKTQYSSNVKGAV